MSQEQKLANVKSSLSTAESEIENLKKELAAARKAMAEGRGHEAEMQRLKVQLTDKHSHIHDIFSDEQLDTRTQLTLLKFREAGRHKELLKGPEVDVDTEEYQQARKDSQFRAEQKSQRDGSEAKAKSEGVDTIEILKKISAAGDREKAFWPDSGILMLGAAAIGKSTQLKRFVLCALEMGMVPVLILVIELVRLKEGAGGGKLTNVIERYLDSQHGPRGSKQHRLLMQAVHERRCLFLVDGVDEAGGSKEEIERAIADELLDQGHKTIVTSRHSGFKMESFERCQLVELLPMSRAQQEACECCGLLMHSLHGDREQWERTEVMAKFKSGALRILVATDVAARGLDEKAALRGLRVIHCANGGEG